MKTERNGKPLSPAPPPFCANCAAPPLEWMMQVRHPLLLPDNGEAFRNTLYSLGSMVSEQYDTGELAVLIAFSPVLRRLL